MSSSDLSEDPRLCHSRPAEQPAISQSSSSFLLLHPTPTPKPLSLRPRRKVPFSLSFTPVCVPPPNRCRLLGFTPLAEHDTRAPDHPRGSFRGPPQVRAKECAPCALFFSRSDVFVSTEMEHQGLLAPSNNHYSSLKAELGQPQPEQLSVEQPCSEPDDGQASVTSSSVPPRFWDEPPASASSTRASSPLSCSDIYSGNPVGLLTPMPIPRAQTRKKSIRRTRSLMVKDDPEECWADDELDEARTESYPIEGSRRMSAPSSGKPNLHQEFELV